MRGKVDDFTYVLIIALALVGVMLLFGYFFGEMTPFTQANKLFGELSPGRLGVSVDQPTKEMRLGSFTVGASQYETLKDVKRIQIERSYFGEAVEDMQIPVPAYYEDTVRNAKINFVVTDTNLYGNLRFSWNGREVFAKEANPGSYTIPITKDLIKDNNRLRVFADSPGIMFWASTVYSISDFEVVLEYGPSKIVPLELFASEVEIFDKGSVEFFGSGDNELMIKVNGRDVFDKIPNGVEKAEFDAGDVVLKTGANLVTFSSDSEAILQNVIVKVFLMGNEMVVTEKLNLTKAQVDILDKGVGKIEFKVDSIQKAGVFKINVNGHNINVPTVETGWNTVTISPGIFIEGMNTLSFSGTGQWDIYTVKVGY